MVAEKSPGAVKMKAGREEQPGLDPDRNKTLELSLFRPAPACLESWNMGSRIYKPHSSEKRF